MLQGKGSKARSVALAILALEEIGKIHLCINAITGEADLPASGSREWRNHRDKLQTAKALELGFVDPEPDFASVSASDDVERLLDLKMSCFYVDHEHGEISRPSSIQEDPEPLIKSGYAQTEVLRPVLDRITPEVLEGMQVHHAWMSALTQAMLDESDPAGTALRLRQFVNPEVLDDPSALASAFEEAFAERSSTKGEPEGLAAQ